ncbi:MAG: putative ABC exporter domain-containing protein, partial [Heliobacteriaceae bacterium]|nr:putative ABC exporter domain-containing protein [Heliobacteriaceae bacterium]
MSDYAILLYYDLLKLKNYGLEIRRNPKKLISYALFIAWIMLFLFPAIKNSGQRQFQVTADTAHIVLAVYALFTGFLMFSSFFSSLRKLSYSFQMGDVNLLFPSPLAPNRILLWSLIKRIPLDMVKTCLPAFCLTPAMINMGVTIEGIFLAYLSIFSFCLLLTPVSFLIFLVSTRYQKEHWVRGILLFSVGWLLFNWLQYVRADLFSLNVFLGYQAPGILNFPLFGWILQF